MDSPVGELTLVARGEALAAVYFDGHIRRPSAAECGPVVDGTRDPLLARTRAQLNEYFAGERTAFDLPLDPVGEEFAVRVWMLLREIPYGSTTRYGALAEHLGGRSYAQAVGGAVGRNPLSIIVPCHRVLGSDGTLTGFAGGTTRKAFLLELEESDSARASRLF
ncbi:methylated-DNA--[protein]-cysteine S-methyltransferase [Mycetocola spongiae]|nr:methylated-DNA--[protein]-cysteine S-methyltransferase [Mycetocola spongiae]